MSDLNLLIHKSPIKSQLIEFLTSIRNSPMDTRTMLSQIFNHLEDTDINDFLHDYHKFDDRERKQPRRWEHPNYCEFLGTTYDPPSQLYQDARKFELDKEYKSAFDLYNQDIDNKYSIASVAYFYYYGLGVCKARNIALTFYKKAANQGHQQIGAWLMAYHTN